MATGQGKTAAELPPPAKKHKAAVLLGPCLSINTVVAEIAQHLPAVDLHNLRQTCKDICLSAEDVVPAPQITVLRKDTPEATSDTARYWDEYRQMWFKRPLKADIVDRKFAVFGEWMYCLNLHSSPVSFVRVSSAGVREDVVITGLPPGVSLSADNHWSITATGEFYLFIRTTVYKADCIATLPFLHFACFTFGERYYRQALRANNRLLFVYEDRLQDMLSADTIEWRIPGNFDGTGSICALGHLLFVHRGVYSDIWDRSERDDDRVHILDLNTGAWATDAQSLWLPLNCVKMFVHEGKLCFLQLLNNATGHDDDDFWTGTAWTVPALASYEIFMRYHIEVDTEVSYLRYPIEVGEVSYDAILRYPIEVDQEEQGGAQDAHLVGVVFAKEGFASRPAEREVYQQQQQAAFLRNVLAPLVIPSDVLRTCTALSW
eukprot:TRINITY_DN942_c0_g3_i1.p1 TRINITY_DN942_c0_g3~~TRINITY_DN942_c0_g3_i1.p1  ORF type:complete len:433 (+),score=92.35 TRINITY_DN942_c0_g3_i1:64-1362(+)